MNKLTRRQFLKLSGATAGAIVVGYGCVSKTADSAPTPEVVPTQTPASTATPASTPTSMIDLTNRYVAYCGLDCAGLCPQYGGVACPKGCLGDTCGSYCMKCPTRACSLKHNVANCALCKEYPCEKLEAQYTSMEQGGYASWAESARTVLEQIHQS
jgi:hypothetical protein